MLLSLCTPGDMQQLLLAAARAWRMDSTTPGFAATYKTYSKLRRTSTGWLAAG